MMGSADFESRACALIGPGVMAYACSVIYIETTMKQVTVCEIQMKLNFFTNSSYLGLRINCLYCRFALQCCFHK